MEGSQHPDEGIVAALEHQLTDAQARLTDAEQRVARLESQLDAEHRTKLGRAVLGVRRLVAAVAPEGTARRALVGRASHGRSTEPYVTRPVIVDAPSVPPMDFDAASSVFTTVDAPAEDELPPPSPDAPDTRIEQEIDFFRDVENVADLPAIFSVWADEFLVPKLQALGFGDIDDIWVTAVDEYRKRCDSLPVRMVSLGSGNCDNEVRFAQRLIGGGFSEFTIECLELSDYMIERATALVVQNDLEKHISITSANLNEWAPADSYDVFIANHSLHHVVELERLFANVVKFVPDDGIFLVNDMIGRNGHMRWPEALAVVDAIWKTMPRRYKYNHPLSRWEETYENWDCSTTGFEGVRAQDILPLLVDMFDFDVFIGFGNVANIFVDRAFGHNFDPDNPDDVRFIRRVGEIDDALIDLGVVKPTQMVGVLRKRGCGGGVRCYGGWTPAFCVRHPDEPPG